MTQTSQAHEVRYILFIGCGSYGTAFPERTWIKLLAKGIEDAKPEVTLADGSRVDILTPDRAVEVEWAKKWPEAIGQACFYGAMTSREPTILLLLRNRKEDLRFLHRAIIAARRAGVTVWVYDTKLRKYLLIDDPPTSVARAPP